MRTLRSMMVCTLHIPLYVAQLTQRKLLTIVLIWRTKPADADAWLALSWELLRRTQRVVNDAHLRASDSPLDYLHMDDTAALSLNELSTIRRASKEVRANVEGQLLASERMLQRYVSLLTQAPCQRDARARREPVSYTHLRAHET